MTEGHSAVSRLRYRPSIVRVSRRHRGDPSQYNRQFPCWGHKPSLVTRNTTSRTFPTSSSGTCTRTNRPWSTGGRMLTGRSTNGPVARSRDVDCIMRSRPSRGGDTPEPSTGCASITTSSHSSQLGHEPNVGQERRPSLALAPKRVPPLTPFSTSPVRTPNRAGHPCS